MFYFISKLIWFFTSPTNLMLIILLLSTFLLFTRFYRLGRIISLCIGIILLVIGLSPVSRFFVQSLENIYPAISANLGTIDGIIILGGATSFSRKQLRVGEAGSRLVASLDLARVYPQARIVFSGGSDRLFMEEKRTEADGARIFFNLAGLPPDRVIYESKSRNTFENALFTKKIAKPRPGERWLLITSAFHMPRSIEIFHSVGFNVLPYPVDFRSDGCFADDFRPFAIAPDGLRLMDLVVKEWIGILVYRLKGYFSPALKIKGI